MSVGLVVDYHDAAYPLHLLLNQSGLVGWQGTRPR